MLGEEGALRWVLGPTEFTFSQARSKTQRQSDGEGLPTLKAKLGKIQVSFLKLLGWPIELIARDKT